MTSGLAIAIVTAAVTAGVTLGGIWLGSLLTSRHEHERWLRQERLEAYAAVMAAAGAWQRAAGEVWVRKPGTPQHEEMVEKFFSSFHVLDLAADRAKLIASDRIVPRLDAMMAHFVNRVIALTRQDPRPTDAEWELATIHEFISHVAAFQNVAREDLMARKHGLGDLLWLWVLYSGLYVRREWRKLFRR